MRAEEMSESARCGGGLSGRDKKSHFLSPSLSLFSVSQVWGPHHHRVPRLLPARLLPIGLAPSAFFQTDFRALGQMVRGFFVAESSPN
jgi:hypothetical protein